MLCAVIGIVAAVIIRQILAVAGIIAQRSTLSAGHGL